MNSRPSRVLVALDHRLELREVAFELGRAAQQQPRLDERSADLRLGAGHLHGLRDRPHALPELDADVENVLRQPAGEVGDRLVHLAAVEQHHVDVGKRRLLPPAVAAVGHQRHPLAQLRGLALRQIGECRVVEPRDRAVDQRSESRADLHAVQSAIVLLAQLLAPFGQLLAGGQHTGT